MSALFAMDTLDVELTIGESSLRVLEVEIEEGMSRVGRAVVRLASTSDIPFEPLIDEVAVLTITLGDLPIRSFTYRLGSASFRGIIDQTLRYELELFPDFHFLKFRRNTRKFRDQTTEAIIDLVMGEAGVAHVWNNTRKCDSRPYTAQYREVDFDFISRLLEYEGIYYTFDDDGTMQLGDASSSSPDIPGLFELLEMNEAGAHEKPGVTSIMLGATFGSGAATVNDFNWKTPSTPLIASAKHENDPAFEIYDYPTGYRDPGVGKRLAKLRLEALVAEKRVVEGTSSVVEFRSGRGFEFFHEEAVSFSGRYMIVSVVHTLKTRWTEEGKAGYGNRFKAIPADVPYRPALTTPRPQIVGNHTAMVRGPIGEEIHTDPYGRAKVQFHWDREATGTDKDSRWIRVLQETSSSIVVSRVGWEVSVAYIDGDPDRPVGLGRQINGQMVPTYGQPSTKNRMTIKTETYPGKLGFNELRMDDSVGSMFMDWHAQRDFMNTVGHNKTEKIANNQTHLVQHTVVHTVEKDQVMQIGADEIKQVGETYKSRVAKDRDEVIGGSEKVQVAKTYTINVSGNDKESVGSVRTTFVGSINISIPTPKELMQSLVQSSITGFTDAIPAIGAVEKAKSILRSPGEFVSGLADKGFPKSKAEAVDAAKAALGIQNGLMPPDIGAALKEALPTPAGILSEATGGLSDIRKPGDLAKLFKGTINRTVQKNHLKMVGAAYVELAGGQIASNAGMLYAEVVGGVKLTTSIDENVTQAVAGPFIRVVGGAILRKAKGTASHSSQNSDIKVGAMMTLKSEEKVELRGKVIELEATSKLGFDGAGMSIELTPGAIKLVGDVKVKSGTKVRITGNPDKLTG